MPKRYDPLTGRLDRTTLQPAGGGMIQAGYLTVAPSVGLTLERTFTAGTGLSSVDGGANSTYTLNLAVPVSAINGGTGLAGSSAAGNTLYGDGLGGWAELPAGATDFILRSNGTVGEWVSLAGTANEVDIDTTGILETKIGLPDDVTIANRLTLWGSGDPLNAALEENILSINFNSVAITGAATNLRCMNVRGSITASIGVLASHKIIDVGTTQPFQYIQDSNNAMPNISAVASQIRVTAATGRTIPSAGCLTFVDETRYERLGTGTIAGIDHTGLWCNTLVATGCTATSMRGLRYTDPSGAGTITTQTAVYVEDLVRATTNQSLYSAGAAVQMRHNGPVSIGSTTAPTEKLEVTGNTVVSGYVRVPSIYGSHSSGTANLDLYANSSAWPTGTGKIRTYHALQGMPGLTVSTGANFIRMFSAGEGSTFTLDNIVGNIQAYLFQPTITWTVGPGFSLPLFLFVAQPQVSIAASMSLSSGGMCAFYNNPTITVATGQTLTMPDTIATQYGAFMDAPTLAVAGTGAFDAGATYNSFVSTLNVTGSTVLLRRAFLARDGTGAGAITTQVIVDVPALAKGATNIAFRSAVAAGATNWCLYSSGDAQSAHVGNVRIGSTTAPTVPLDVTGAALISSTLGIGGVTSLRTALATVSATETVARLTQNMTMDNAASILRVLSITGTWTTSVDCIQSHSMLYAAPTLTNSGTADLSSNFIGADLQPTFTAAVASTFSTANVGMFAKPVITVSGGGSWVAGGTSWSTVSSNLDVAAAITWAARYGVQHFGHTGAGAITTDIAFQAGALTGATSVGLDVGALTGATFSAALRSAVTLSAGVRYCIYSSGTADSVHKGQFRLGDTTTPTALLDVIGKLTVDTNGVVTRYNNIATVSNGVPSILAQINLTAQSAALATTALYTPAAAGLFRISVAITLTRAATTSSVLAGAAGVKINYTSGDGATAKIQQVPLWIPGSTTATVINSSTNTVGDTLVGSIVVYSSTTAMTYDVGYTSVGGTTMQFAVRIRVEAL